MLLSHTHYTQHVAYLLSLLVVCVSNVAHRNMDIFAFVLMLLQFSRQKGTINTLTQSHTHTVTDGAMSLV